jgi:hypothetical protein
MNEKVSTESVIEQIQEAIQEKINLVGRQSISIDNGVSALAINAKSMNIHQKLSISIWLIRCS